MAVCSLENPPPPAVPAAGPHGADPVPAAPADDANSVFVFPATGAQRRFWLLDGFQPGGNPALNVSVNLRLSGPLDRSALERALGEIAARHESLRTTFQPERGQLQQLIAPDAGPEITFTDADDFPAAERGNVGPHLIAEEARRPFDLARGPLWRARLVHAGGDEHCLLLTLHHIICDGWSNSILLRELKTLYDAFARGLPSPLEPLPLQFADYAEWQTRALADEKTFAPALAYWREKLAGRLPAVELPADGPRTPDPGARRVPAAGSETRVLPAELTAGLRALAVREGVSMFMLSLAAFQVLLHRLSGETDVVLSTTSANRGRQELENLIGLFANPLLLRTDLSGDPTARDLLARVRRTALEAFAHGELPFERLIEELRPERLPVSFLHQTAFIQPAELAGGLRLTPVPGAAGGALFELIGVVQEDGDGVTRVYFEFNADLFERETIRRWLGHYQTVLESLVADPSAPISALAILTGAERRELGLEADPLSLRPAPPAPDVRALLAARREAPAAREGRRELSCAELLSHRGDDDSLAAFAAKLTGWRTGGSPTPAPSAPAFAERCRALAEHLELRAGERLASFSPPGSDAAREESGAALLAGAVVVFPHSPERLTGPPRALADWLEREKIAVACLPAAAWNRLAFFASPLPGGLRAVLATVGDPGAGSFGRGVTAGKLAVRERHVSGSVSGTLALDGRALTPGVRLAVLDARRQPQPVGVPGELCAAFTGDGEIVGTGELARRRADGTLERLGRAGDDPRRAGALRRREAALLAQPGVRHALATPAGAYVFPVAAKGALALADFPLTADGRLDLAALPAPDAAADGGPATDLPWLTIQHQLIEIWQDVLGVPRVGLRDDFFALGGNSLLAMRMLARVEEACGRTVLPSALFTHATVAGLAAEITRQSSEEAPAILPIQESGEKPPLFYLHGDLTGGGYYCLKLSRVLGPDQPFYALPPLDVHQLPLGVSLEAMAAAHWEAIRAVRPHGPYRIGGFCVGGLVAFELARQIAAAGETVERLVIIDADVSTPRLRRMRRAVETLGALRGWDAEARLARFTRGHYVLARLRRWRGLGWREQARIVRHRVHCRLRRWKPRVSRGDRRQSVVEADAAAAPASAPDPGWDAAGAFLWATAGYRAGRFEGPAVLLLSSDLATAGPENPTPRWRRFLPHLGLRQLTGSHLACLTDHVDSLGRTIQGCLEENGDTAPGL